MRETRDGNDPVFLANLYELFVEMPGKDVYDIPDTPGKTGERNDLSADRQDAQHAEDE